MIEDAELLRRYAEEKSEEAFAELVRRRIGLVYAVAFRHTHDAHRAEEVTQAVFTALARKAGTLSKRAVLVGWLYRSAQFSASDAVRAERRRQVREQAAHLMQQIDREGGEPPWDHFQPGLDEMLNQLPERDRDAVLLRFFDGQSYAEIGRRFSLPENSARMRVERALGKLHALLERRGVKSSSAALAAALSHQAANAAPVGLAASVTGAAFATAAQSAGAMAGLITFMTMNKLPITVLSTLVAVGTAGFVLQSKSPAQSVAPVGVNSESNRLITSKPDGGPAVANLPGEGDVSNERPGPAGASDAPAFVPLAATNLPAASDVYDLTAVDEAPKVKYRTNPLYPFEMRRAGITGTVLIEFTVDLAGEVRNAVVARSTRVEFESSALQAIEKWKFVPGMIGGRAVNTRMQVPFAFTIEN